MTEPFFFAFFQQLKTAILNIKERSSGWNYHDAKNTPWNFVFRVSFSGAYFKPCRIKCFDSN